MITERPKDLKTIVNMEGGKNISSSNSNNDNDNDERL